MTVFEHWQKNRKASISLFAGALFEAYLLATEMEQGKLKRAFPSYFIEDNVIDRLN